MKKLTKKAQKIVRMKEKHFQAILSHQIFFIDKLISFQNVKIDVFINSKFKKISLILMMSNKLVVLFNLNRILDKNCKYYSLNPRLSYI